MSRNTVTASVRCEIEAAPDEFFDAWLEPELVRRWMSRALREFGLAGDLRRIEVDARPGGEFCFSDLRGGEEAVHWGSYRVIDRPRRLRFSWFTSEEEEREDLSLVTLELEPHGSGTRAKMSHEMSAEWADYVQQTEQAWERMLRAVGEVLNEE